MKAGQVVGLQRTPARRFPPEPVASAEVKADWGLVGDRHARPGSSRQVVLVEAEVLDELGLHYGATREQLTVSGLAGRLVAGVVLEIGEVRLELVRPRVPCPVMEGVRPGLESELRGRGGWCARVVGGGVLSIGDPVVVSHRNDPAWLADFRHAMAEWEAAPFAARAEADPDWRLLDEVAHLTADAQQATAEIHQRAGMFPPSSGRPVANDDDVWIVHDDWTTAVLDLARRYPVEAEEVVAGLTARYRDHT